MIAPFDVESALVSSFPVAQLSVQDVDVAVVFPGASFDSRTALERQRFYAAAQAAAARAGLAGETVLVWQDRYGGTSFMAPPQQHPFFRIMSCEQLQAQVNGTLLCE